MHNLSGQLLNDLNGLEALVQREDFTEPLSQTLLPCQFFLAC